MSRHVHDSDCIASALERIADALELRFEPSTERPTAEDKTAAAYATSRKLLIARQEWEVAHPRVMQPTQPDPDRPR